MRAFLACAALFLTGAAQAPEPTSIEGLWRSPGGNSIIGIAPCGEGLCGTVKWASQKAIADARKGTDQLIGSDLLTDLEQKKPGQWQGKLFVPDKDVRVTAKIQLAKDGRLRVSGCLAGKSLCKSQLWVRTAEPLPASD